MSPAAPAAAPDTAKLMLQVKGLLMEMDELRYRLRERESEVEELRRQLATVEQLIGRRGKPA